MLHLSRPAYPYGRRPVLAALRGRLSPMRVAFATVGPGLIAGAAANDAAGVSSFASAGAQYGYRTLFVMLVMSLALAMVQEMSVRLPAHTGKGLGTLIREQFGKRWTVFALGLLLVANSALTGAEFAGVGAAFELFGVSRYAAVPVCAVVLWALVVFGTYRYIERFFLLVCLAFLAYPVAMVLSHPDWGQVARGLVVPHLDGDRGFVLVLVAMLGTTASPYMQFYAASSVADAGIGPSRYRWLRMDAIAGAAAAALVSIMIIIATAATLGGAGAIDSPAEAAQALRPVVGPAAEALFALGLFGGGALAAAVVPLSSSYAIAEAMGHERSISAGLNRAPLFLGLFTVQIQIGELLALLPVDVIKLQISTQLVQGIITPVILVFVLILANRRRLLGSAANGRIFKSVATATVAGMAVLSTVALGQTALDLF